MPANQSVTAPPSALSNFNNLPDDALVRVRGVAELFNASVPTVWRWSKNGTIDPAIRVGGITGWRAGGLRKILAGGR
jgi:predicted DNA-binding transcriptional regulator AlpA